MSCDRAGASPEQIIPYFKMQVHTGAERQEFLHRDLG